MEKHGAGVEEACGMLDVFASLEVDRFAVTQTDLDGHKRSFRPDQQGERLRCGMAVLLESAITAQQNVIVRPQGSAVALIQLDDLSEFLVERVRWAAFLILATSPGNHQAWVAARDGSGDLSQRLRPGCHADANASGAARLAGSINFKRKYAPQFPQVRLLEARPNHIVASADLEAQGLVAPPRPMLPARIPTSPRSKRWPSYECCLKNAPLAHGDDRPDISRADFTFCLIAIDWGWSVPETCHRLLEISSKARAAGEFYARLTVQRAASVIARRNPERGS